MSIEQITDNTFKAIEQQSDLIVPNPNNSMDLMSHLFLANKMGYDDATAATFESCTVSPNIMIHDSSQNC